MGEVKALDTNVLVRFFVGDNKKQQRFAEEQFRKAEQGKLKLLVHPIVIAEMCFVLDSFYKIEREQIAEKLQVFLSQRWLKVVDREILLNLWKDYKEGLHFVDSFLHTWAELNKSGILTFDEELKKK